MTEGEQLTALLMAGAGQFISKNGALNCTKLADYLIASGVIVPPCKVGDIVYVISRGDIVQTKVDTIQYNSHGCNILGRNERYWGNGTITLDPDNKWGAEWYLTREEAKAALAKIKGGNDNE